MGTLNDREKRSLEAQPCIGHATSSEAPRAHRERLTQISFEKSTFPAVKRADPNPLFCLCYDSGRTTGWLQLVATSLRIWIW